jgi:hypothetical protein
MECCLYAPSTRLRDGDGPFFLCAVVSDSTWSEGHVSLEPFQKGAL